MSTPTILLWINESGVYRDALVKAGLADRLRVEALRLDEKPDPALLARCDAMLAWRARTIAGAGLDVFRTEPLPPEHPFWTTDGITVLPHIGGLHPARDELVAELFVDNVERFLAGRPFRAEVDRAHGY